MARRMATEYRHCIKGLPKTPKKRTRCRREEGHSLLRREHDDVISRGNINRAEVVVHYNDTYVSSNLQIQKR